MAFISPQIPFKQLALIKFARCKQYAMDTMIHCHQHTIATSVSRRRRARVAFFNSRKLNKMVKVRNRTRGHLHDYFLGDIWGIFELVVKESGGERSDGKKKKHHSPLALCFRSHHPSRFSLVPWFPLSLGKACGGSSFVGSLISAYISEHATGATPEECESSNAPSP